MLPFSFSHSLFKSSQNNKQKKMKDFKNRNGKTPQKVPEINIKKDLYDDERINALLKKNLLL